MVMDFCSQDGRIDGVSGPVDLDWFAGDVATLDQIACQNIKKLEQGHEQ